MDRSEDEEDKHEEEGEEEDDEEEGDEDCAELNSKELAVLFTSRLNRAIRRLTKLSTSFGAESLAGKCTEDLHRPIKNTQTALENLDKVSQGVYDQLHRVVLLPEGTDQADTFHEARQWADAQNWSAIVGTVSTSLKLVRAIGNLVDSKRKIPEDAESQAPVLSEQEQELKDQKRLACKEDRDLAVMELLRTNRAWSHEGVLCINEKQGSMLLPVLIASRLPLEELILVERRELPPSRRLENDDFFCRREWILESFDSET